VLYGAPRLNNMVHGDPVRETGIRCYRLCADLFEPDSGWVSCVFCQLYVDPFEPDSVASGLNVCFVSFM